MNDTNLYELCIPKDIYDVLCTETDNMGCTETDNMGCTETVQLKDNLKEKIKDKNKRKEEVANAPLSPDGDSESVSVLLKNLNIKENNKNIQLITNKIKDKDSIEYIKKIINTEIDFYKWVNTKEYTCDTHKLNTCLKFILEESDKRYEKNNQYKYKNNNLLYGRYTKEEVDDFHLNLSMGADYPELLEFIQIEQNYNSL